MKTAHEKAVENILALCDDPGGPDSWTHTFESEPSIFVSDVRAAIAEAIGESK